MISALVKKGSLIHLVLTPEPLGCFWEYKQQWATLKTGPWAASILQP